MQSISINKPKKPFKCKQNSSCHGLILIVNLIITLPIWLTAVLYSPNSFGQPEEPTEYRLKAAFLYNFASFPEPPTKIDKHSTFNMCFLDYIAQRKVKDLQVTILLKSDPDKLSECHLLYISRSAVSNKLESTLDHISSGPILTVADSTGTCQKEVVTNMGINAGKITFEANLTPAHTAKLELSSQLLRFAKEVYQ